MTETMQAPQEQDYEHITDGLPSEKTARLREYLSRKAEGGEIYVKGKFISDEIGLTPKQIGMLMLQLQDKAPELTVEKWSYTGATTWRIQHNPVY